ncbi:MAG TPA: hypothetical protein PLP61_09955 [Nocardioides sp.]|uniref:PspA-associated protein PspAA n=1 Tax=Nocardioides sp. TaxID=35761 RepID=UPI002CA46DCB|nr:hypothetical protein [Nocardioides sp.]HQR27351.1 hypothetical protein [Nocardioides sp.]
MIVRILGEGQLDVPAESLDELNRLDDALETAVASGDEDTFAVALADLLGAVRAVGTSHDLESLVESDVILPPADATLAEVREMLDEHGLIPD